MCNDPAKAFASYSITTPHAEKNLLRVCQHSLSFFVHTSINASTPNPDHQNISISTVCTQSSPQHLKRCFQHLQIRTTFQRPPPPPPTYQNSSATSTTSQCRSGSPRPQSPSPTSIPSYSKPSASPRTQECSSSSGPSSSRLSSSC